MPATGFNKHKKPPETVINKGVAPNLTARNMIVFSLRDEVASFVNQQRKNKKSIGFVATMGALHHGHLSLIDIAKQQNDVVICSIFVNPLQFNNKNDFDKYPHTLEADLKLLEAEKCDVVFTPSTDEVYNYPDPTIFNFGKLDKVMEGVYRPGHFEGMAKVVKRLFDIVQPDTAYFGEKDFQQLAIIRKFSNDLHIPLNITGCPIVRETDGLAMSSRNILLSHEQRNLAPQIFESLKSAKKKVEHISPSELKKWVAEKINEIKGFELEYFEIANVATLETIDTWDHKTTTMGFIVVRVGTVRLIDNIVLLP